MSEEKPTKKEIKESRSPKATERMISAMSKYIEDPQMREESAFIIRALDLKKIRNTSKT